MVSIREIKRVFSEIAPERQLPLHAVVEFQTRMEMIMKDFAKFCETEAGGEESSTRLTPSHVKLAFVNYNDEVEKKEEKEEEEFGEWNDDE